MGFAYVDSSAILAVGFQEQIDDELTDRLGGLHLLSSNLLEAELRAAHAREQKPFQDFLIESIEWVLPERALGPELQRVLDAGYLRGADLWHVAVALSVVEDPGEITFITLDERQREVAAELGFQT